MKASNENRLHISDELTARRFADTMVHMLDDFIPRSAVRDAHRYLFDMAMSEKFELTTLTMRNEYLAHKQVTINPLLLTEPK